MDRRWVAGVVAVASLIAFQAFADDWNGEAEQQGMVALAPGVYAVPGDGAPMWYAAPYYYSCGRGVWSASGGGDQPWTTISVASLPQDLAYAIDAQGYAQYGLCPGDALPPRVSGYLGGPTVVVVAGLPRIVRYGHLWSGWLPRSAYGRRAFLPPPCARPTWAVVGPHNHSYYTAPYYAPSAVQTVPVYRSGPSYAPPMHSFRGGVPAYVPPRAMAPAAGSWGNQPGGGWGHGGRGGSWGGRGHAGGRR